MKEILYFLKWQLKRWTFFDVMWAISCVLIGSGMMEMYLHPNGPTPWQLIVGFAGWFALLFKMAVINSIQNSWQRYQQEKAKLLADLKETNA